MSNLAISTYVVYAILTHGFSFIPSLRLVKILSSVYAISSIFTIRFLVTSHFPLFILFSTTIHFTLSVGSTISCYFSFSVFLCNDFYGLRLTFVLCGCILLALKEKKGLIFAYIASNSPIYTFERKEIFILNY